ncbi:salivary glue protein Sgs-3-like [Argopecten irradians]|uniref:salivary glue protein Sgs-3-like n=1 Tax=Argopecten irradians TaxID=31199 RepID=UPI0037153665
MIYVFIKPYSIQVTRNIKLREWDCFILFVDVTPFGSCLGDWHCPSKSYCDRSLSIPPWDCECDSGYLEQSSSCIDPCDIVVCQSTEHCDQGVCQCNTGHQRSQQGTCEPFAPTTIETTTTDVPTSTTTETTTTDVPTSTTTETTTTDAPTTQPLPNPPVVITIETTADDLQSTSLGVSPSAFTQSTTTNAITTSESTHFTSGVITTIGTSCNCVCVVTNTTTTLTISQIIEETSAKVKIDTTTLSSHRRKLTCATDDRQSSQTIGVLGAFLMAFPFTCMLLSDIFSSLRYMCEEYFRSRKVDAIS